MLNPQRTTQTPRTAATLALLLAGAALAAPASAPTLASLKATAAPIWNAFTQDHVAGFAGPGQWVRIAFTHDAKAIRYEIHGNNSTISAPGTAKRSRMCDTEAAAKRAPWTWQKRRTLILHFSWKKDRWEPGQVEWRDK